MKRKTRWSYLYLTDPIQLQTWLEDESLKGWKLESLWRTWGKFRKVKPHRIRYRIEPDPVALSTTDGDIAEKNQLYGEMGWERVGTMMEKLAIYASENPDAPEPHTDPETLRAIWKQVSWRLFVPNIGILICFLLSLRMIWRLYGGSADRMANLNWFLVWNLVYWFLLLVQETWHSWRALRPYRRLRRGDGEPYRAYPTSWWSRWRPMLVWMTVPLLIVSVAAAALAESRYRSELTPTTVEGAFQSLLPEDLLYLDAEALGLEPGGDQRILYFKALHTVTAHGCSTFSLYWDEGEGTVDLRTSYYHMRGDWLTGQIVEKLLAETAEVEELSLPGVDGAWQGREGDRQASPFVLVRRGNQAVYLQYDKTLEVSPEEAAAVLADLLDRAAY